MNISRTETIDGMLDEYQGFAELLKSLDETAWQASTRCHGFEVRDVAGHVVGLAEDVAAGVPGSRTAEEEAATVRTEAPTGAAKRLEVVVDQLRAMSSAFDSDDVWNGPSSVPDLTMGEGVLTLWYDVFVHGDDIRAAIGRPSERGAGLRAALTYLEAELTRREWGPARVTFDFADAQLDDLVISGRDDDAPVHRVAPMDFVLAATGRRDPKPLGLDETVNIYRD